MPSARTRVHTCAHVHEGVHVGDGLRASLPTIKVYQFGCKPFSNTSVFEKSKVALESKSSVSDSDGLELNLAFNTLKILHPEATPDLPTPRGRRNNNVQEDGADDDLDIRQQGLFQGREQVIHTQ